MKKLLVAGILGLAATTYVQGQGQVILYNYTTPSTYINYGANSGGTLGTGIVGAQWTIALYYAAGDVTGAANAAMSGDGGGGALAGGFTLAPLTSTLIDGYPGQFNKVVENLATSGTTTFIVVAYNGLSYADPTSTVKGHSLAFTAPANVSPTTPVIIGQGGFMSSFSVVGPIPEPSTFALAGLGLASLLIFRRRK